MMRMICPACGKETECEIVSVIEETGEWGYEPLAEEIQIAVCTECGAEMPLGARQLDEEEYWQYAG